MGSSACLWHGWRRLPQGGLERRRTRLASREEFMLLGYIHPTARSEPLEESKSIAPYMRRRLWRRGELPGLRRDDFR